MVRIHDRPFSPSAKMAKPTALAMGEPAEARLAEIKTQMYGEWQAGVSLEDARKMSKAAKRTRPAPRIGGRRIGAGWQRGGRDVQRSSRQPGARPRTGRFVHPSSACGDSSYKYSTVRFTGLHSGNLVPAAGLWATTRPDRVELPRVMTLHPAA